MLYCGSCRVCAKRRSRCTDSVGTSIRINRCHMHSGCEWQICCLISHIAQQKRAQNDNAESLRSELIEFPDNYLCLSLTQVFKIGKAPIEVGVKANRTVYITAVSTKLKLYLQYSQIQLQAQSFLTHRFNWYVNCGCVFAATVYIELLQLHVDSSFLSL